MEKKNKSMFKKYGVMHFLQTGLDSTNSYKYKDYVYPSGKIVKIQGYENYLLDELILIHPESEILTDRKDMPEFWYVTDDSKKHRYFPDVYIPKTGTIYEVKSSYTLEQGKKNRTYNLKEQSVIEANYIYILKVY